MPTDPPSMAEGSILDSLGLEIIGVMSPVSICMLLVVLIISALAPPPSSPTSPPPVTAANLLYQESSSDSISQKLAGSLLNAAAFVLIVAAATFLLVLLYYYNFTGCLRNYMRFSAFFVLASMGGSILFALLHAAAVPIDAVTALVLLFNASVVGMLSIFCPAFPIVLRQGFTVTLGVIVAAWFTRLPEWTTWTLLFALAVYDLVAVLAPRGPLRLLVELASSRDDELPALVYEARPTLTPSSAPVPILATFASPSSVELQPLQTDHNSSSSPEHSSHRASSGSNSGHSAIEIERLEEETSPLVANEVGREQRQLDGAAASGGSGEMEMFETTRGIRLGLGDFVFYSVLVGRAAMYDLMTVYACYLAIVSGLGCTLILLSICRHALPALPISIMLGGRLEMLSNRGSPPTRSFISLCSSLNGGRFVHLQYCKSIRF